jgi:hypothetical protein
MNNSQFLISKTTRVAILRIRNKKALCRLANKELFSTEAYIVEYARNKYITEYSKFFCTVNAPWINKNKFSIVYIVKSEKDFKDLLFNRYNPNGLLVYKFCKFIFTEDSIGIQVF